MGLPAPDIFTDAALTFTMTQAEALTLTMSQAEGLAFTQVQTATLEY